MSKDVKTLEEELKGLAAKIPSLLRYIKTEEGTKTAIIWPLLRILGYDPFDPREIVPEYPAPPGYKLGKKVDIAILVNDQPSVIWECKHSGKEVDQKDADQLREYFPFIASAHLAILTNGINFQFFADGDRPNVMDKTPFFEVDLLNLENEDVELLSRFKKANFNPEQVVEWARSRSFVQSAKDILLTEFGKPSEDFVKLVVRRQNPEIARIGSRMLEIYTRRIQRAARELLTEQTGRPCIELPVIAEPELVSSEEDAKEIDSLKARNEELTKEATASNQKAINLQRQLMQLRTLLTEILVSNGVRLRKEQSDIVNLIEKSDGSLLCQIYFDSISKELGFIDGKAANERVGLQQFTGPPDKINGLLKLLDVNGAFGSSQVPSPSEPFKG